IRIPVVDVMRRVLEMPLRFARLDVDRHERRGVEVVPDTRVAVPIRTWIAGAPVQQLQLGIVRTGQPRRAAAVDPTVAGPRFAAWLSGRWDRPEAPQLFAGLRVIRVEEAADARFAAADADNHFVVDDERRGRDRVAKGIFADVDHPSFDAGARVERHE